MATTVPILRQVEGQDGKSILVVSKASRSLHHRIWSTLDLTPAMAASAWSSSILNPHIKKTFTRGGVHQRTTSPTKDPVCGSRDENFLVEPRLEQTICSCVSPVELAVDGFY